MKASDDRGWESAAPLSLFIIVSAVCATQQGREGKEHLLTVGGVTVCVCPVIRNNQEMKSNDSSHTDGTEQQLHDVKHRNRMTQQKGQSVDAQQVEP